MVLIRRRHSSPPDLTNGLGVAKESSEKGDDSWRGIKKDEDVHLPPTDVNDNFVVVDEERGKVFDDAFDGMQTQSQSGKSEENIGLFSGKDHYKASYLAQRNTTVEERDFSNSLIIHQEKTKKITTVTVVWICIPNYHKILPTLSLNFSFEKPYQTPEGVFHQISKHLEVVLKKTRLRLVFATYFSVFGYLMKHTFSCLIYYFKIK